MEHLYQVVARLYSVTDVDDLARIALDAAMDAVGAEAGSLLLGDSVGRLRFAHVAGPAVDSLRSLTIAPEDGVAGSVFRSGVPRIDNNAETSVDHLHSVDQVTGFHTHSLLTVPLRVRGGQSIGVLQLVNKQSGAFDSTDLSLAELIGSLIALTLHNAQLAADAQLAAVAHVVGEVSHDIGNLLTHVLPYVQTLKFVIDDVAAGKDGAVEELVSFYAEVEASVEQGVTQVMSLTREIAAAVHGEVTPLELVEGAPMTVLRLVADSLRKPAEAKGTSIHVEGDESIVARHDPHRLRAAVYNAANNALAATPPGADGVIQLIVFSDNDADYYRIKVRDNGSGMTTEQAARLFTDSNRSTKSGGTGLGARIIRRVAEQHGGTASVISNAESGTEITLRLPLTPHAGHR
jgi:signal transduction histidine kinase